MKLNDGANLWTSNISTRLFTDNPNLAFAAVKEVVRKKVWNQTNRNHKFKGAES